MTLRGATKFKRAKITSNLMNLKKVKKKKETEESSLIKYFPLMLSSNVPLVLIQKQNVAHERLSSERQLINPM